MFTPSQHTAPAVFQPSEEEGETHLGIIPLIVLGVSMAATGIAGAVSATKAKTAREQEEAALEKQLAAERRALAEQQKAADIAAFLAVDEAEEKKNNVLFWGVVFIIGAGILGSQLASWTSSDDEESDS